MIARVRKVAKRLTRRQQTMVTVTLADGSGFLDLTFFNQPWAANLYKEGMEVAVSGVATLYQGRLQLANQEVEVLGGDDADLVHTGADHAGPSGDRGHHDPDDPRAACTARSSSSGRSTTRCRPTLIDAERLGSYDRALRDIHFPDDDAALAGARERLKFDELFTLELGVAFRKHRVESEQQGVAHEPDGPLDRAAAARRSRSSPPTRSARAMRRDRRGDGASAPDERAPAGRRRRGQDRWWPSTRRLVAIQSGHQAAIMAPTEVLAGQHARSVADAARGRRRGAVPRARGAKRPAPHRQGRARCSTPSPRAAPTRPAPTRTPAVTYALLTGGRHRARTASASLDGVADGSVDLVIGTHALVQEAVTFADLSLAVVDEQHRFGLHQRIGAQAQGAARSTC